MLHDGRHRVRLDRVREVDAGWKGGAQKRDALREQVAVVREERRTPDPLGEPVERYPADTMAARPAIEGDA